MNQRHGKASSALMRRRSRAKELRAALDDPTIVMHPLQAENFKRMIWDLEQPPFRELRRTLYIETIGMWRTR